MKNITSSSLLFLSLIFFTGCPYESLVPIYCTGTKVDKKLLGEYLTGDNDQTIKVTSTRDAMGNELYAVNIPDLPGTDENKKSYWEAKVCVIGGTKFIQFFHPDDEPVIYYIYKLESGGVKDEVGEKLPYVRLTPMSQSIKTHPKYPEDLRDYIKDHQKDTGFFTVEDEETYFKK